MATRLEKEKRFSEEKRVVRVLITTDFYKPHSNGVAFYVENIVSALKVNNEKTRSKININKKNSETKYEITILTYAQKGAPEIERLGGVTVLRAPALKLFGDTYRLPKKLPAQIKQTKQDVVITNTRFFTLSLIGARLSSKWSAKHIHIEHGAVHVPHSNPIVRLCAWVYDQTFGRYVIASADKVVCVSNAGKSFVKQLGAKEKNIAVIPNAVNAELFKRGAKSKYEALKLRKKLSIPKQNRLLLFVGRMVREKGVDELLEAAVGMKQTTLVLVGSGPQKEEFEARAKQLKLDARFVGEVRREALAPYYWASNLFINPSWAEGMPTSVLEALAAGAPVIATNVGGTREIVSASALVESKNSNSLKHKINNLFENIKNESIGGSKSTLPAKYTLQYSQDKWREEITDLRK